MVPGENPLRPFGAEKLPADKKPENLAGKELSQPGVVDPGDPMEHPGLVHSSLGHQEMEMGVEIDPGSEGLDGGDDSGHQLTSRDSCEIADEGAESREAE